jgi:hypothetical protein
MASALNTKINSYALERGIEFDSAYPTTSPYISPRTGTNPFGNWTKNQTANIVWEPTVGPAGGSGSWKLQISTVTATESWVRGTVATNSELLGVADKNWSTGFWFKLDTLPTGTSTSAMTLHHFGDSGGGYIAYISGTNSSNPGKIYIQQTGIGGIEQMHPNSLVVGQWYYFAATRDNTDMRFYLNGTLIFSGYTNSTGSLSTLMWGDTSARVFNGSWNISNYYLAPLSVIGVNQIAEIWTVGSTTPSTGRTVKYYNGTAWVNSSAQKVYNGTAWVDWNAKKYDGTAWVTI